MKTKLFIFIVLSLLVLKTAQSSCQACYNEGQNSNCKNDPVGLDSYTLHMSVHPHLDAFWIFDFDSYYDPKPNQGNVHSYFASNRFHSVKQIFDTITNVLTKSKQFRESVDSNSQKGHRSFLNSQMGFFKRWYNEQNDNTKNKVKALLKTKYWEIVGGGFVEHDQGCAYYDDIIQNYQTGLRFLKQNFEYYPRTAISADSFGHSQTTLAILAHMGVEGYFVERSDEHILLQNKTQFIWNAKSANGITYGALPTHIRWAIHGFQDQFRPGSLSEKVCETKTPYLGNMRRQNQFLKRILKSTHIMRYFGHDFQQFDEYSYMVMQGFMEQFSREKCRKVSAVYGNPTEYFQILMGQVFGSVKPVVTRSEDIFPIWDYDSGLYWTGYYTTDPFHKKNYRDAGRLLHAARKAFLPGYISDPNSQTHKQSYQILEQLAETVSYLQHHDGVSGTSKYSVMDEYENLADKYVKQTKDKVLKEVFENEFPINTINPIFECNLDNECTIPEGTTGDIYLKIFNSAGQISHEPIIIHLNAEDNFEPDCEYYEINCLCQEFPCPCDLYLYAKIFTYTLIKLKRVSNRPKDANILQKLVPDETFSYNKTHFTITLNDKKYSIGYKRLNGDPTPRNYDHLSRYGDQYGRSFTIKSGKYALGNNPSTQTDLSSIRNVLKLQTDYLKKIIIKWNREQMKTIITIPNDEPNSWKVETLSAAEGYKLQDLYLEVATSIENKNKFFTDSNGWLVVPRTLYEHEDYKAHFAKEGYDNVDGNSYPMTAFCYIEDSNDKVSINTDRPQGVIAYKPGTLWVNYDRLSSDDGKWVYETTFRNEYQKFVHHITVQNKDYHERNIQKLYDQPLLMQGNQINQNERVESSKSDQKQREKWAQLSGLQRVKLLIKPWNDSTVLLRVHNLDDDKNRTVDLFASNVSPLLTTFYGNVVKFSSIEEMSLGGNMKYEQFIANKWNWESVVNLRKENDIFRKTFQEKITLRPLEIRTFLFRGFSIDQNCIQTKDLVYTGESKIFELDYNKEKPKRKGKERQDEINKYLLHGDHCKDKSPVLKEDGTIKHEGQDQRASVPDTKPIQRNEDKPKPQEPQKPQKSDKPENVVKPEEVKADVNRQQNDEEDFQKIRAKIFRYQKLSKQEKRIYFKEKLRRIKVRNF